MTIAMAFKFNGGTVIAADRQGTRGDGTISLVPKMYGIENGGILAFASEDANWVKTFMRMLKASNEKTPIERLRDTAIKYDIKALEFGRNDQFSYRGYPREREYACVYAENDSIYEFHSRNIPEEESRLERVIVGAARPTAETYVRLVEFAMRLAKHETTWSSLKAKSVERLCWFLLQTLEAHVDSVHGKYIYEITKGGKSRRILWNDVKAEADGPSEGRLSLEAMMESVWDEVKPQDLANIDEAINFLPKGLKTLFHAYADGREKWD